MAGWRPEAASSVDSVFSRRTWGEETLLVELPFSTGSALGSGMTPSLATGFLFRLPFCLQSQKRFSSRQPS